jgi:hypothetical protein
MIIYYPIDILESVIMSLPTTQLNNLVMHLRGIWL